MTPNSNTTDDLPFPPAAIAAGWAALLIIWGWVALLVASNLAYGAPAVTAYVIYPVVVFGLHRLTRTYWRFTKREIQSHAPNDHHGDVS